MMLRRQAATAWAWVGLYAALIFYLSSFSRPLPDPVGKYFQDWMLHGVEYAFFGILLARALGLSFKDWQPTVVVVLAFVLGTLYGISDEWHQSFVPERESCAKDALVDAAAVFFGASIWVWKKKRGNNTLA